ncbi:MAG TPA: hypothetical protein VKA84_20195 [Gemmatimonadaceae bacterium]|nr:hypothetical protein [Gemmatimonadaceae bacterium]
MHIAASTVSAARVRRAAAPLAPLTALAVALAAAAAGACASGGSAASGSSAAAATAAAAAPAIVDPEERAAYERAGRLRRYILENMVWTELGADSCRPGEFRSFRDTSAAVVGAITDSVAAIERVIITQGVEDTIDTPAAHDLLRTVVGWEAGVGRPLWDVLPGETKRREAIATGLTGAYDNPQTGKCETLAHDDTIAVIIPPLTSFRPPSLGKTVVRPYVGEEGLKQARDWFYAARGAADPNALFTYVRVAAFVPWRDYALVAINRPAEARGILQLPKGAGGASYIFHRVGTEWRLLSIVRTWG